MRDRHKTFSIRIFLVTTFMQVLALQPANAQDNPALRELAIVEDFENDTIRLRIYSSSSGTLEYSFPDLKLDQSEIITHKFPYFDARLGKNPIRDYLIANDLAKIVASETPQQRAFESARTNEEVGEATPQDSEGPSRITRWRQATFSGIAVAFNFVWGTVLEVLAWLGRNLMNIIAITALLVAFVAAWFARKWYHTRYFNMFFVGVQASGKSGLIRRLQRPDMDESEIEKIRPTQNQSLKKADPIRFGELVVYPDMHDVAGSEENLVLDSIMSLKRKFRRRYILVFVISPHREFNCAERVDEDFVKSQFAAIGPIARILLRAKNLQKPNLVAVFLNKIDSMFELQPDPMQQREFENLFRDHLNLLRSITEDVGLEFLLLSGSARKGWNTQDLLNRIGNIVTSRTRA